ncbi:MAG: sensor histidine kinase, partial [Cellulosilyticaceae bacterium]
MKKKMMLYYSVSFILACLTILFINGMVITSNFYKDGLIYHYYPEKLLEAFHDYIYVSLDNQVEVTPAGIRTLDAGRIGLQILDENNQEVFAYHKPEGAPMKYSNVSLIAMYSSEEATLFLEEKVIADKTYTYLLFLEREEVKRMIYSYDARRVEEAHRFPILLALNSVLIIIISFLYTIKITKPINRIISRILTLSQGNYMRSKVNKGIYFEVEAHLNQLSDQLRSNEQEREKLDQMREEWISNISHDIKTPLTSIMGNAEIMVDTDYEIPDETRVKCCSTILRKSEYIKTLVEDLNLSTRLKNNTLALNKKQVNIVSLMRHVIIDLMNDEKYCESNIGFVYSDEEILREVDPQLIKRVFINLIMNALVHNGKDVTITITIQTREREGVFVTISDNGKGVAEEELENIFKRYYRGTNTSKKIEG